MISLDACWMMVVRCWWLAIGVSRWSRPSLLGRGRGRGQYVSPCSLFILFSQNYTDEQTSQRCTETLSQPITQSVSANDGCNVLWYIAITLCDICRLLADVCVFPLFAERLLSLCENLWEIKHATTKDVRWMASVHLWTLWEIEYTTNQDVCRKSSVHLWNSVRDETSNEPYSRQKSL